jgi:hypothetical protein
MDHRSAIPTDRQRRRASSLHPPVSLGHGFRVAFPGPSGPLPPRSGRRRAAGRGRRRAATPDGAERRPRTRSTRGVNDSGSPTDRRRRPTGAPRRTGPGQTDAALSTSSSRPAPHCLTAASGGDLKRPGSPIAACSKGLLPTAPEPIRSICVDALQSSTTDRREDCTGIARRADAVAASRTPRAGRSDVAVPRSPAPRRNAPDPGIRGVFASGELGGARLGRGELLRGGRAGRRRARERDRRRRGAGRCVAGGDGATE